MIRMQNIYPCYQDRIMDIDAGARERTITAGGRDRSVRVWKIVEESQLVFNVPTYSIDCVRLLNEEHWVTAGEDGHLAVWGVMRKKPLGNGPISNCKLSRNFICITKVA